MKIKHFLLLGLLINNDAWSMAGAAVAGLEALAENPAAQQLLETVAINGINTFAHSSTLSNLTSSSHSSLVSNALKALTQDAPQVVSAVSQAAAGSAAAPIAQASANAAAPANSNQAALNMALQQAQQVEQQLATNPSPWARVLRILIGFGFTAVGAADLITNYVYTQKDEQAGKQATSSVLGTPIDLTLMGGGLYNIYLGVANWDTKAKQADAATTTHLIQGHIAQQSAPVAAAPRSGSANNV